MADLQFSLFAWVAALWGVFSRAGLFVSFALMA